MASPAEREYLMSGVGTLAWPVRMCRPGYACITSQLQSIIHKPTTKDLRAFNRTVKEMLNSSSKGIHYRKGVDWHNCVVLAVSDASHAGSSEYLGDWGEVEPFRSQGGLLVFLASPEAVDKEEFSLVLIAFGSSVMKRVVRSTI